MQHYFNSRNGFIWKKLFYLPIAWWFGVIEVLNISIYSFNSLLVAFNSYCLLLMSSSSIGIFSPYKCLVEGEVVGSRSTGCVCNSVTYKFKKKKILVFVMFSHLCHRELRVLKNFHPYLCAQDGQLRLRGFSKLIL